MKTIKIILFIIMSFIINEKCLPYAITINNICQSPNNPTPYYYPTGNINIDFRVDSVNSLDRGDPLCRIYLVQNGTEALMFSGIIPLGTLLSTPLSPESFPGLQYNEPLTIKITVNSTVYPVILSSRSCYLIIFREGIYGQYGCTGIGNVELLIHNQIATFISSSDCLSAATSNYITNQYRITFTLQGDFTDSVPQIVSGYSFGYSGSLPNFQNRWAYVINQTNSEIKFITFSYKLKNILGHDIGSVPCTPEKARVVYRYVRRPFINNVQSYPAMITPSNNIALLFGNTSGYYDSTSWTDSNNIHNNVLIPHGDYAVLRAGFSDMTSERVEWYSVQFQVFNNYFSSNRIKYYPLFGSDPQGCPAIGFKEKGYYLSENHILTKNSTSIGTDITDYYKTYNPFNAERDTITFSITENQNGITKIDQLQMYNIEAEKNTEAAVTDQGEVINFFNDPNRNKIILNSNRDVTEELRSSDNKILKLNKDSVLTIITPDGNDNYLVVRGRTTEQKDKVSCLITTSFDEESEFYFREMISEECIKLDKKGNGSLKIKALQNCEIDRIALVSDLKTNNVKELKLISANDQNQDISKLITARDNIYLTIGKRDKPEFSFFNQKNPEKELCYFLKISGRYDKFENINHRDHKINNNNDFEFKLYDNYPNPFNPTTSIVFEIPEDGIVRLTIFDITGRHLKTIINEYRSAGLYEESFDGSAYGSGIYFYRLESGRFKDTGRMILIK